MTDKKYRLSRRAFLRSGVFAGAVYALPAIVPCSVFGEDAPSNRIAIGIIGTGSQGILNLKAFLRKPSAQVIAVCDVDYSHREEARKIARLSGDALYNDFRELLARQDVDAVVVCTPDQWHVPISIAAAKAGKDIYCEKPLAYNVAEGRMLCDAVKRYERVLQTGTHQRSDNNFRRPASLFATAESESCKQSKLRYRKTAGPIRLHGKLSRRRGTGL